MSWEHIVFDLYGTLADIHTEENEPELWEHMAQVYEKYGAVYTPVELQKAYQNSVTSAEDGKRTLRKDTHEGHPEIQLEYVFQKLFADKGASVDLEFAKEIGKEFRRSSTKYIRLYPGAEKLLQELRSAGKKVWLLSNAQHIFTAPELEYLKIDKMFDGIYLSSDYGCKKPDTAFFEILLNERNITPESAVMVGNDGICDIQGAKNAGMASAYLRSNISPKEPFPDADCVLPDVDYDALLKFLLK